MCARKSRMSCHRWARRNAGSSTFSLMALSAPPWPSSSSVKAWRLFLPCMLPSLAESSYQRKASPSYCLTPCPYWYIQPSWFNASPFLGEYDQVFAWFEQAFQEQSNMLQSLKVLPLYDDLRDRPRFKDLLR